MADDSFKIYFGEDLLPEVDLTDEIYWPEVEVGGSAQNGSVGVGTLPLRDDAGTVTLPVLNRVKWTHGSNVMFQGRLQAVDYTRGAQVANRTRQQTMTVDDYNIDLQGIPIHEWTRPFETDKARVQGLVAAYLSGSPRPTTSLNGSNYVSGSNTISLEAKRYTQTNPLGVLAEIASETDKDFFVDVDGNLHWDGHDSMAFICPFYITDRPEEHLADPTHALTIIPNMGPTASLEGQELSSLARVYYTTELYKEASNPVVATNHAYWAEVFNIDGISSSEAQQIANTLAARRAFPGRSYAMTVGNANGGPLTEAQIGSIKYGMMIRIKARVTPDAPDAFLWRRIADLRWSRPAPGQYYAHLRLDKLLPVSPTKRGPLGPQAPTTGTPGTTPPVVSAGGNIGDLGGTAEVTLNIPTDVAGATLYAVVIDTGGGTIGIDWQHHSTDPGSREAFTLIDSETVGGVRIGFWRRLNPTPTTSGASFVRFTDSASQERFVAYWYVTGVDQADPDDMPVFANGVGSQSAVTVPDGISDLILNAAGWWANNQSSIADPTAGGGQTLDYADSVDRPSGQPDGEGGAGHGSAVPTWNWGTVQTWLAGGIAVHASAAGTAGDSTSPVGGTGEDSPGTNTDTFAPIDHVHEHGDITTGGPYHEAADVTYTPTGTIAATNVQDAITELDATVTAGALDDETDYLQAVHGRFIATYHRSSDQSPFVLYSEDGITWRTGDEITDNTRRDPSIIHWDGKFWVATTIGVTTFLLQSSTDLLTWDAVGGTGVITVDAGATNCWAPEWIKNFDGTPYLHPSTGLPCLTINVSTDSETTFAVREMHPTVRAMTTWSSTTTITGTGLPTRMIDAALYADTDQFYLWFKDESDKNIEIAQSASLTSGYTMLESGDWAGWFAAKDAGANSIEGPSLIRLDDGRWRVYFNENNGFTSIRAVYSETTDDWRTGTSTWTTQAVIVTDDLMSHGTVLYLPGMYDHLRDENAHVSLIDGLLDTAAHDALDHDAIIEASGHYETIVSGSAPPVAVTNEAADDWLVGWVAG